MATLGTFSPGAAAPRIRSIRLGEGVGEAVHVAAVGVYQAHLVAVVVEGQARLALVIDAVTARVQALAGDASAGSG